MLLPDFFKLRSEETDKWVAEFNSSLALLSDLIKCQRESAEKAAETARSAVEAKAAAEAEKEKTQKPGCIEIEIVHKDSPPVPVTVRLDDGNEESVTGTSWTKRGVIPGYHKILVAIGKPTSYTMEKIVKVPADDIARAEFKLT